MDTKEDRLVALRDMGLPTEGSIVAAKDDNPYVASGQALREALWLEQGLAATGVPDDDDLKEAHVVVDFTEQSGVPPAGDMEAVNTEGNGPTKVHLHLLRRGEGFCSVYGTQKDGFMGYSLA